MKTAVPFRWFVALFMAGALSTGCGVSVTGAGATGGGENSTATTSGAGGTASCTTAADCPGTDGACSTRTCAGGGCGVELAPLGVPAGAQASGDCQKVVCDGNGGVTSVADDTDVPSDGNPCTVDVCANGAPAHPPAPAGASCGPGGQLACDGMGQCAGCALDADCGASTACAVYTCNTTSGLCAVTYVPSGQGDPGGQTSGDCQKVVCNGSGGALTIADDTDVPDDGNPCTVDGCSMGQPEHPPKAAGTPCGNDFACDGAGACQACLADADCGAPTACATPACSGGTCVTAYVPSGQGDPDGQTSGDCQKVVCDGSGGTLAIGDDTDVPDDGNPCTADACAGGVAGHTPLAAGTICGSDLVCDGAGSCVGCLADADCGASTVCATHHCQMGTCVSESTPAGMGDPGGQVANDCQKLVCNGSGGTMTVPDDSDVEDDGDPCTIDFCSGGVAQHSPAPGCAPGCVIGGSYHAADTVNPNDVCQVCNPSASKIAWSSRPDTTACDDGNACTKNDHCTSGVCGGTAYTCAATSCQASAACDGQGGCTFANEPIGTLCPDGRYLGFGPPVGVGVCDGIGKCVWGCFVNGGIYPAVTYFLDAQICQTCDPAKARTSLYTGGCHANGRFGSCSGTGVCNLLVDSCDCADCNTVKGCGSGACTGVPKPSGTSCSDEGNPCTADLCNGTSSCTHPPLPDGTACGTGLVCMSGACVAGP